MVPQLTIFPALLTAAWFGFHPLEFLKCFQNLLDCLCQAIIHCFSKPIPHQDFCFEPTETTAPLSQSQQAAFPDATLASSDSGTTCCSCPCDPVLTKDLVNGSCSLELLILFFFSQYCLSLYKHRTNDYLKLYSMRWCWIHCFKKIYNQNATEYYTYYIFHSIAIKQVFHK